MEALILTTTERPRRVLLVDDDEDIVDVLGSGLRSKGYRVETFTNPSAALTAFAPHRYDIAVLDVRMMPFDGMELYRRLKGLDPKLIVCFLTAYADMMTERPTGIRFLQELMGHEKLMGQNKTYFVERKSFEAWVCPGRD